MNENDCLGLDECCVWLGEGCDFGDCTTTTEAPPPDTTTTAPPPDTTTTAAPIDTTTEAPIDTTTEAPPDTTEEIIIGTCDCSDDEFCTI